MNAKLFYYQDLLPETPVACVAEDGAIDDRGLVTRVIAAYQKSVVAVTDLGGSIWSGIAEKSRDVHEALLEGDVPAVTGFLRHPHQSNLLYGFENVYAAVAKRVENDPEIGRTQARWAHDVLIRVAEVTGAIPTYLPEVDFQERPWQAEALVDALEHVLQCQLRFPNPIPFEWGCSTGRGVISYRATQAIYQAWRLRQLSTFAGGTRTVEIGAGLGRTAFFATILGFRNYTIVDLPLANAAQAYFLGRSLGPDRIVLHGEQDNGSAAVRIENATWFQRGDERFDLALNADSMTEIGIEQVDRYWKQLSRRVGLFVSMNHEAQSFRVADLPDRAGRAVRTIRNVSPVRKGYIEEIFFFDPPVVKDVW